MIYTVTCNPSLDYIVTVNDFQLGQTNRTTSEQMLPGGKGINVSTVLKNLGVENTALGFVAGFTGREIVRKVRELGFQNEFLELSEGWSRINIKMKDFDGTEINGKGPEISEEAVQALLDRLDQVEEGDVLVLAGSIPESMPSTFYAEILSRMQGRGILTVVDATNNLLLEVLQYRPFLVKPNQHELGEIFGVKLETQEDVIPYAGELQEKGAVNVLVSMGSRESRFPVGSSARISSGSLISARQIAALCFSPPESSVGFFSKRWVSSNCAAYFSALLCISLESALSRIIGKIIFSRTVRLSMR